LRTTNRGESERKTAVLPLFVVPKHDVAQRIVGRLERGAFEGSGAPT
jgi:hypothetical protein